MLPPNSPVDNYVRVSTEDQKLHGSSPEVQEDAGRLVCQRLGLHLLNVVHDEGESSKDLNRPGLQAMLARLRAGEIRGVVVQSVDRLSRSIEDAEYLRKRHFQAPNGAWIISDGAYVDTRSAVGRFTFRVLIAASQLQRELGIEKTISTLGHKRSAGQRIGRDKFGWKTDPTNPARSKTDRPIGLVPDEADHAVVAEVLRLAALKFSRRAIAAALDATNYKPKRAAKWSPSTVQKILKQAGVLDEPAPSP